MIANQSHAERNFRLHRIAHRGGHSRIRHRHDQIRVHGMFAGQLPAQRFATVVHASSKNRAVRARKIHMLKNAELVRLFRRKMDGFKPRFRNAQHLTWFNFPDILRIQQVERACLARHDPRRLAVRRRKLRQIQRTEPARVAHRVQLLRRQNHQ